MNPEQWHLYASAGTLGDLNPRLAPVPVIRKRGRSPYHGQGRSHLDQSSRRNAQVGCARL
jgi:hypothetical protein